MRSLFVAAAFALLPPSLAHTAPAYQQGSYEPTFDMSELNRFHGKQPVTRKIKAPKTLNNQSFAAQPLPQKTEGCNKVRSNGVVFPNSNEQGATMVAFEKQFTNGTFGIVGDYNPHKQTGRVVVDSLNLEAPFHVASGQVVMDDPNAAKSALCTAQTLMNHYDESVAHRAKNNGQSGQPDGWFGPFVAPNGDHVSGGTLGGRSYTFRWTTDKHVFASSSFAEPNGTYKIAAITLRPFRMFPDKLGELTKRLTGHDPASDAGQKASARILLLANALHSYTHPQDGRDTNSPQNTALFSVRAVDPKIAKLWDVKPDKDLQILNANEINPRTGKDYLDPSKTQGMSNRAFQAHLESMLRDAGGSAPSPYRYMPQSGAFPSPR